MDVDIQLIAFVINNTFNRTIRISPFEAFHGWAPIVPSLAAFPRIANDDLRQIDFEHATRVMKHRILLNELFAQRELIKAKRQIRGISVDRTEVLFKSERPVGSSKLFNPWLGLFEVIKRIDNDSYLISPKDDPRKKYIAYRGRLKRIGDTSKADTRPKMELNQEVIKNDEVQEKQKSIINDKNDDDNTKKDQPEIKYDLRRRHNTDYRKFS